MRAIRCIVALACLAGFLGVEAWAAEPTPHPEFYGLYCWSSGYVKYADDVQKIGISWLRDGNIMGPSGDKAALLAAKNGVHLTPTLILRDMSHKKTLPVEEGIVKFRKLARDAVLRYGPGGSLWKENPNVRPLPIRYWQIWNEPNIEFLTPPSENIMRTALYAKLLKAVSQEIRKLDPGAKVIAFNTAGGVPYQGRGVPPDKMWQKLKYIGWRKFIRDVNVLAGVDCYDAVGTHPYTKPKAPDVPVVEGVKMVRELARQQKFMQKPLWFTEVGFPLEYPNNQQVRDERQQASYTVRLFAVAGAHGVMQVQIMYIEDIIYGPDSSKRSFGFFTEPGKWREQATATEVMIDLVPDPRRKSQIISEKADGVWAYQFRGRGGWPVIMAWKAGEGTAQHTFELKAKEATLVDILGKSEPLAVKGGRVKVALGEAPVYLVAAPQDEVDAVLKD